MLDITHSTILRRGLALSSNVNLDLLTKGVVNTQSARYNISQTSFLYENEGMGGINPLIPQKWKIARNLQNLAQGIVEPLISEYSTDLMIHSAYVNPNLVRTYENVSDSKHFTGESIDISVKEYEGNMIFAVEDVLKMFKGKITELGLIFNQRSWLHLSINGDHSINPQDVDNVRTFTRDLTNNRVWNGFYPARGLGIYSSGRHPNEFGGNETF